jgi:hypothetical protein
MCGKVNFMNMSRYSNLSERTYRRQYLESFDYIGLNALTIREAIPREVNQIAVMDCTFIPKSGGHTAGLDWFYNGSASRSEKGLELSVLAVVDVSARRAYTLSVQQTPARPKINVSSTVVSSVKGKLRLPLKVVKCFLSLSLWNLSYRASMSLPSFVKWMTSANGLTRPGHNSPNCHRCLGKSGVARA